MNQFSKLYLQGTQRKFVRLFVSTEQKKFIATVDSFEQNLSEQIANSYACACEQFQSEPCQNGYLVTNIRQNGFSVIIPKELNIGQVLNDQSYITCKICKVKNKNKKTNNCQRIDKKSKKLLKEQQKIDDNLPNISPPKILTSNNLPLPEKKDEKIQQNPKKRNKRKKKKNQQVQNQSQKFIDGIQKNYIEQNVLDDQLQFIQQSKDKILDKNPKSLVESTENNELYKRIDNIYCDDLISNNKDTNQQTRNNNMEQKKQEHLHQNASQIETIKDQMKNDQKLIQEQCDQDKSQINNQKNNLKQNNTLVTNNESNLLLKKTFNYLQDFLNKSQEIPRVANTSFQTNIEHSTKQKKQKYNNQKQQQQSNGYLKSQQYNDQLSQNKKQNYIVNQSINQNNQNIHKNNNTRHNKQKGKKDI